VVVQVLRIATAKTTYDETEAVHRGRSRSSTVRITRHDRAPRRLRRQSHVRLLWQTLVFHCNVVTYPRVDNETSVKLMPRFSLWQMVGRSLNRLPFSQLADATSSVNSSYLPSPTLKMDSSNGFCLPGNFIATFPQEFPHRLNSYFSRAYRNNKAK
jgi:hypothetical protein